MLRTTLPCMRRPCNIVSDEKLWCVIGTLKDGSGGGIICWCYDEDDANYHLEKIKALNEYNNIVARKWLAN